MLAGCKAAGGEESESKKEASVTTSKGKSNSKILKVTYNGVDLDFSKKPEDNISKVFENGGYVADSNGMRSYSEDGKKFAILDRDALATSDFNMYFSTQIQQLMLSKDDDAIEFWRYTLPVYDENKLEMAEFPSWEVKEDMDEDDLPEAFYVTFDDDINKTGVYLECPAVYAWKNGKIVPIDEILEKYGEAAKKYVEDYYFETDKSSLNFLYDVVDKTYVKIEEDGTLRYTKEGHQYASGGYNLCNHCKSFSSFEEIKARTTITDEDAEAFKEHLVPYVALWLAELDWGGELLKGKISGYGYAVYKKNPDEITFNVAAPHKELVEWHENARAK